MDPWYFRVHLRQILEKFSKSLSTQWIIKIYEQPRRIIKIYQKTPVDYINHQFISNFGETFEIVRQPEKISNSDVHPQESNYFE